MKLKIIKSEYGYLVYGKTTYNNLRVRMGYLGRTIYRPIDELYVFKPAFNWVFGTIRGETLAELAKVIEDLNKK